MWIDFDTTLINTNHVSAIIQGMDDNRENKYSIFIHYDNGIDILKESFFSIEERNQRWDRGMGRSSC